MLIIKRVWLITAHSDHGHKRLFFFFINKKKELTRSHMKRMGLHKPRRIRIEIPFDYLLLWIAILFK